MSAESLTPAISAADALAVADLGAILGNVVPGLVGQVTKRIDIDQIKADAGKIGDLDIDRIVLGDVTIDNIELCDTSAHLHGAQAQMRNVRMVMMLKLTLDWDINLGPFGTPSGDTSLGSMAFAINLGDVNVPSLANIDMKIPSIKIPDATATIQPINNLDLGGASFKKLVAKDTDAPANGFTLTGIGVNKATVRDMSIPKTSTASVTLDEFKPDNNVTIPGMSINHMDVPAAHVDTITTTGFNFLGSASSRCITADLGMLDLKLCAVPSFHLNITAMTINNAELSAAVGRLDISSAEVPVTVRGISMKNLDVLGIKINTITMK